MAETAKEKGITKKEAVRQSLEVLGWDTPRSDIAKHIKEHFGHDMDLDHISSCKGDIRREAKQKKKKAATTKSPAEKSETTKPLKSAGISFDDIESVKSLVERVGADGLKRLIGMLSK